MKYFLIAFLAFFSACSGDEASLRGSLGDFYDIDYSTVRARLYASELSIEYVQEDLQVPVRVTLRKLTTGMIEPGAYDLTALGAISGRSRDNDIPDMTTGKLVLERFEPVNGSEISGSFEAKFRTGNDEATLVGEFNTTLEVVDQIDGYDADLSYLYDAGDMDDQ